MKFATWLGGYFDRWMEMSETLRTYEGLRNQVIIEQFMGNGHEKLKGFLKERRSKEIIEMAELTDQYLEAQGHINLGKCSAMIEGQRMQGKYTKHSERI